jgi:hypothetical protein
MFFPIFKSERDSVGLLVPTYPDSEIDERVRCGGGEEGIYDCGGMSPTATKTHVLGYWVCQVITLDLICFLLSVMSLA